MTGPDLATTRGGERLARSSLQGVRGLPGVCARGATARRHGRADANRRDSAPRSLASDDVLVDECGDDDDCEDRARRSGAFEDERDVRDRRESSSPLSDGRRFGASVFTLANLESLLRKHERSGENAGGLYLWAARMMVMRELSLEGMRKMVEGLIADGELEQAFELLDPIEDPE